MLEQFQFQNQAGVDLKIRAVHFDNGRASNVRTDQFVSMADAFAIHLHLMPQYNSASVRRISGYDRRRMKWLRLQVALLAIAVSFASAQCIAACAGQPCHDSSASQIPPCHRHHPPKENGPQLCQHPFFVAKGRGRVVAMATPAVEMPMARIEIPCVTSAVGSTLVEASRPGSPQPDFYTILRV
jgi:hypothetical protein